ncbi:phage tail protein [Comamonas testosteroni]|uniref:phage tail tube protein n=1 Tax=Comamonas testosteroni TaxID=285 RepID=UPI0023AA80BE|nr:phage tail tube protein [Comamonas testosteroni]WEE79761.1 phage tail protein [Comamonas testosteroni]
MASTPSGSRFALATELAAAKVVTAVTNAVEAVCESAAHGLVAGDIVIMNSGWDRFDNRVFRIKAVVAPDSFTLEGRSADSSNTSQFPVGGGIGTVTKVLTWVDVLKVLTSSTSGGDPKKVNYRYIESENEQSINDGFNAVNRALEIDADAIDTLGYQAVAKLSESGANTVMRTTTKKGATSYLACTVAMNEEVLSQDGAINRVSVDISGKAKSTRYGA